MEFVDKVNSIKEGVLNQPKYKKPIEMVVNTANKYTSEKKIEKVEDKER